MITVSGVLGSLFILIAGHFLADFGLQSDVMSREKRRASTTELQKIVPWYWWLTSHAFIHGFVVWFLLGIWWIALAETVAHWLIDFGKCEGYYGMWPDQLLHLLCKIIWITYVIAFALPFIR